MLALSSVYTQNKQAALCIILHFEYSLKFFFSCDYTGLQTLLEHNLINPLCVISLGIQ